MQSPEEAYRAGVEAGKGILSEVSGNLPTLYLPACCCCCAEHSSYTVHIDGVDDWDDVEGDGVIPFKQDVASFQARLLLIGNRSNRAIIIPSRMEWIGLNVMERDGTLDALKPLIQVRDKRG